MTIFTEELLRICVGPERGEGSPPRWVWRHKTTRRVLFAINFSPSSRRFHGKDHRGRWQNLQPAEIEELRRQLPPEAIAECTAASLQLETPQS